MKKIIKQIPFAKKLIRAYRSIPRLWLTRNLPKDSCGAEIGVHEGEFSEMLMNRVNPHKLYLIDPWKFFEEKTYDTSLYGSQVGGQTAMDDRYQRVLDKFNRSIREGRVEVRRDLSATAADGFEDGQLDWVYIDGNHLYDYVMEDLIKYDPKVKPGGFLAGDDFGVVGWWENGVEKAVRKFVQERPGYKLEVRGDQFMIQKPA